MLGTLARNAKPPAPPAETIHSPLDRLEAQLVDISAKEPLRVKEVLVDEGDLVRPGQVLVRLDTVTLDAQLAEANAQVTAAQEKLAVAEAAIRKTKSQIQLATIEADRSKRMLAENATSQSAGMASHSATGGTLPPL